VELTAFISKRRERNEASEYLAKDQVGRVLLSIRFHRTTHPQHVHLHNVSIIHHYIYRSLGFHYLLGLRHVFCIKKILIYICSFTRSASNKSNAVFVVMTVKCAVNLCFFQRCYGPILCRKPVASSAPENVRRSFLHPHRNIGPRIFRSLNCFEELFPISSPSVELSVLCCLYIISLMELGGCLC
jgi:hypothetical protein